MSRTMKIAVFLLALSSAVAAPLTPFRIVGNASSGANVVCGVPLPVKDIVNSCRVPFGFVPATIHSKAQNDAALKIAAGVPIYCSDATDKIVIGLYSEHQKFKWLGSNTTYDFNNIRKGVEIPDGPTYYVLAFKDTAEQKAGEWLPVDGNVRIAGALCVNKH
ncbi:unnamed protein product [Bursaphelenchus xylophilus]|uniref:(pine wood nematode) hypothetical protein n=1 Tax=Bursaphelenchus xylophilus TaxID=6326 RepID=A0A1I7SEI7_BURXY|nr:unnamed protein product [Bursaphelenchus xylophilus]CAG9113547.1 unnamed protein product [Bursaphelenchus xylophilus]